jgi:uncharacterized protein (TIGR02172 family)
MTISKELTGDVLIVTIEGHIDTATAPAFEFELMSDLRGINEAVLDCGGLEYISSSGLRVLLKLRKAVTTVRLTNVSSAVYEILEMTGFTEMLEVEKALRKISIDGCEKIGQGGNGAVYRLDDETIVKVYRPKVSRETVDTERRHAKTAFVHGLPTAIAYDVVRVGDSYGAVYELMSSDTLGHALLKYPDRREELLDKYAALVHMVGETHIPEGGFERIQDVFHKRLEHLRDCMEAADLELLHSLVDCIPDSDTLIHGDLHPGNIMLQGDELMLIDMADLTVGAPGYELLCIYYSMCGTMSNERYAKAAENTIGMPREAITDTWNGFIRRYLGTEDTAVINRFMKEMALKNVISEANILTRIPVAVIQQRLNAFKEHCIEGIIKPNEQELRRLLAAM